MPIIMIVAIDIMHNSLVIFLTSNSLRLPSTSCTRDASLEKFWSTKFGWLVGEGFGVLLGGWAGSSVVWFASFRFCPVLCGGLVWNSQRMTVFPSLMVVWRVLGMIDGYLKRLIVC